MRIFLAVVTVFVVGLGVYFSDRWIENHQTGKVTQNKQISRAKAFSVTKAFTNLDQNFELTDHENNFVIIHFWATWCGPCINELPELLKLAPTLKGLGYKLIAVAENENWGEVNAFFKEYPALAGLKKQTILILDPDRKISSLYGSVQFPETYIINKNFDIESVLVGSQSWAHPEMEAYFRKILVQQ